MSIRDIATPWPLVPLRTVVRLNPETLPEDTDPDREFSYIDIGSVTAGQIDRTEEMRFEHAPSRARRVVRDGDVLVSTVRTYLRAVAGVGSTHDGQVASTGFAALRPDTDAADPRFVRYWCLSEPFVSEVVGRSTGVSYPAINASEVVRLPVALPPVRTQQHVADYLDRETQRIDELVLKNDRMLALLAERRRALVDAELRTASSGESTRLRRLLRTAPSYGVLKPEPDNGDDGVPLLRVLDLTDRNEVLAEQVMRIRRRQATEYQRTTLAAGDVLLSVVGTLGRGLIVPREFEAANVSRALARLQVRAWVDPRWLLRWFESTQFIEQVAASTYGTAQAVLNMGDLSRYAIPTPPEGAGSALDRLDGLLGHQDGLAGRVEAQSKLLRERRQALITAAVTGQLDIGEAA